MTQRNALIIGAGSAGLACAALLAEDGFAVEVLERGATAGAAWHGRYTSLRLNTIRSLSGLPGLPIPRRHGRWVTRDDFAAYLAAYARHHDLTVTTGVTAGPVTPAGDGRWKIEATDQVRAADVVIVAAGHDAVPDRPAWPGRDAYTGLTLHSAHYQDPAPFTGKDVLIVGAGNSGTEIAMDLLDTAASLTVAVRTPPLFAPVELHGIPLQLIGRLTEWVPWRYRDEGSRSTHRKYYGDLAAHGLPVPELGMYRRFRKSCVAPVAERGFADAVRQGRVQITGPVADLHADGATLSDGTRIGCDAVIEATGYRPGHTPMLAGLDVLDAAGRPLRWAEPLAPGLFAVGSPSLDGTLRAHGREAAKVRDALR